MLFATPWPGEPVDAAILLGGALAVVGMTVTNLARR